ncbi:hypothetical protein MRX96_001874 [Rhipicephalus microplus]
MQRTRPNDGNLGSSRCKHSSLRRERGSSKTTTPTSAVSRNLAWLRLTGLTGFFSKASFGRLSPGLSGGPDPRGFYFCLPKEKAARPKEASLSRRTRLPPPPRGRTRDRWEQAVSERSPSALFGLHRVSRLCGREYRRCPRDSSADCAAAAAAAAATSKRRRAHQERQFERLPRH